MQKRKAGRKPSANPSPNALRIRAFRKHGKTAAERRLWEADHAFPYPPVTMFDLIRAVEIYHAA